VTPSIKMSTKHEFHNVHWLVTGGNSCVYEVHRRIVLKVPKPGQEEKEQFRNEVKVLKKIFSQQTLCPYIVQCFLFTDNGIFSEYMHGKKDPVLFVDYFTNRHLIQRLATLHQNNQQPNHRQHDVPLCARSERAGASGPA
jgi:predicted Ser/Thr protein kinase